jgi:hypothetical protein
VTWGLIFVALAASPDGGLEPADVGPPQVAVEQAPPVAPGPAGHLKGAAEVELALFPSGVGDDSLDLLLSLRPVLGFSVGTAFSIELGPTLRLRVVDLPPLNRSSDYGGVLRRADWDELSDYGQILQSLTILTESSPFFLKAGVVRKKTLGLGHLVNRYSNQENPDYHPAGATAVVAVGPVRLEAFASDVLGGRLFAGELAWDLGRTFSSSTTLWDRFGLGLEAAHDLGIAGRPFRVDPLLDRVSPSPVTMLELDGWAVLLRTSAIRAMLMAGVGSRVNAAADLGLVAGGAVDATVAEFGLSVKAEFRKQAGGFRHGLFGPTYELSRFADTGFSGPSIAAASLPDGFSVYGEARVGVGSAVSVDAAVEHFFFGRTDLDASASLTLLDSWLLVEARFTAVGLGPLPRYAMTGSVRARLFRSFYLSASGGTVFFPQLDGTLLRGVTASAGVGVDFER